jgi:hypothetical protein
MHRFSEMDLIPQMNLLAARHSEESQLVIYMNQPEDEFDFVTMYNILSYLYLGIVNLPLPHNCKHKHKPVGFPPPGYPPAANPFILYKTSKKLLLDGLSRRCLEHLKFTLTPDNVSKRLFAGNDGLHFHEELVDEYIKYVLENYAEVKNTESWKDALSPHDCGAEISKSPWSLMYRITQRLSFSEDENSGEEEMEIY